jgi:hypothetical protein
MHERRQFGQVLELAQVRRADRSIDEHNQNGPVAGDKHVLVGRRVCCPRSHTHPERSRLTAIIGDCHPAYSDGQGTGELSENRLHESSVPTVLEKTSSIGTT